MSARYVRLLPTSWQVPTVFTTWEEGTFCPKFSSDFVKLGYAKTKSDAFGDAENSRPGGLKRI
jgi:hypothetical protein